MSKGGKSPDGRKVKGTLHWVNIDTAIKTEVRLYDRLFNKENPEEVEEGKTFIDNLNPDSLTVKTAFVEPEILKSHKGDKYQFERIAYFCVDKKSSENNIILNRTVTLKDTWSKIKKSNF